MPSDLMISQDKCFTNLSDCIGEVDVVYMTRVQKERINDPQLLDSIHNYSITPELMQQASSNMILMHPLPRVNELPMSLDNDPRAKYFEQIGNGLLIRQAIFYSLAGGVLVGIVFRLGSSSLMCELPPAVAKLA